MVAVDLTYRLSGIVLMVAVVSACGGVATPSTGLPAYPASTPSSSSSVLPSGSMCADFDSLRRTLRDLPASDIFQHSYGALLAAIAHAAVEAKALKTSAGTALATDIDELVVALEAAHRAIEQYSPEPSASVGSEAFDPFDPVGLAWLKV